MEADIKRSSWLDVLASAGGAEEPLTPQVRRALAALDDTLFEMWNLGENIILVWTHVGHELRFLLVRHYAIAESINTGAAIPDDLASTEEFINKILAGSKFVPLDEFERIRRALENSSQVVSANYEADDEVSIDLVNGLVTRYGVSLVREKAVVLLDAVGFSLHSSLEQVAMLNSLTYSVNSAYRQLLSKDIQINFARTTTGDGFYIWNRTRTLDANLALYKLMMLILADNAVAQRKAQRFPVPRLRAAFHIGEHFEFYQVEALNPTTFGYIVGQVTIDLARMIEKALPGQIILGDFNVNLMDDRTGAFVSHTTLDFVERTASTLEQLKGLVISGDEIEDFRCYLTGESRADGTFAVTQYTVRDKHGLTRSVYNAKINIHRREAEPIFLGIQHKDLNLDKAAAS